MSSEFISKPWIPIMSPSLGENELKYVSDAVQSGWISSQGSYVERFERLLADYNDVEYALAVSNGTVALHLALESLGIGKDDEVIVPDLTFAATINAVLYTGATPVVVDVNYETYNIDTNSVKKAIGPRTKAIMPVHLYGNPCLMDEIRSIANQYHLFIVEDSAEAIGSSYRGSKLGSLSDVGTYSFYGNKTITTGEGGAILFANKERYEKAKLLRDHGMNPNKRYWHDFVGFNYRITNMQAAIGVAQMEKIDDIIEAKIKLAEYYKNHLSEIDEIKFQITPKGGISTFWLVSLIINGRNKYTAKGLMEHLRIESIDSRPFFYPLSEMPVYQEYCKSELIYSKELSKNGLSLPSFIGLSEEMLDRVVKAVKKYFHG